MRTKILFLFLFICFALTSCNKDDALRVDNITLTDAEVDIRTPGTTVEIYESPDGELIVVPGSSSKLHRNESGITVNFKTENLIPGNAYTMWCVIFGDAPGPPVLVTYAAGNVVGESGKGNFSGHLNTGDIFNNPITAEVHLAIRSHGPVQPEEMPGQIQTIDGGCNPDIGYPSGPTLYPDSDVVGYCANVQVAMHPSN